MKQEASLIILLHNNIDNHCHEKSVACLDTVFKYTHNPYELILIDNGSTDKRTKEWFDQLQPSGSCVDIRKFERMTLQQCEKVGYDQKKINERRVILCNNTSSPCGFNLGIKEARTEIVAFMNNDMILNDTCDNWLARLIDKLYSSGDTCMMVGIPLTYKKAFDVGRDSDKYIVLFGFSVMKKELVDYIGYIDERYVVGMYDDDDMNCRMRRMGFTVECVNDIFPEHKWQDSAIAQYDKNNVIHKTNRKLFNDKWRIFGYEKY